MNHDPQANPIDSELRADPIDLAIRFGRDLTTRPCWPQAARFGLLARVERAMVNRQALRELIKKLRRKGTTKVAFASIDSHLWVTSLCTRGLAELSDEELIDFALDPVALQLLHREVGESVPDAWKAARVRDGMLLFQENDQSIPSQEDLLKAARDRSSRR